MRRTIAVLAAVTVLLASACGGGDGGPAAVPNGSVDPSASPRTADASASPAPIPTVDPEGELCQHMAEMEFRLATLQAVELRLTNRTALDVELDGLMTAYDELDDLDLGSRREELERPLTRLGYRLDELGLAVEDFRTNTRPRRAAPHVEEDTRKVADELAAFVILSRC